MSNVLEVDKLGYEPHHHRPLRQAGWLISLGLLFQTATLFWSHPMAFLAFIGFGGSLVALGILRYLWSLFSGGQSADAPSPAVPSPAAPSPAAPSLRGTIGAEDKDD